MKTFRKFYFKRIKTELQSAFFIKKKSVLDNLRSSGHFYNLGIENVENEILKLKQKKATRQSKFLGFWSTLSSDPKRPKLLQDSPRSESLRPMSTSLTVTTSKAATDQPIPEKIDLTNSTQEFKSPAQEKCSERINELNKKLVTLICKL